MTPLESKIIAGKTNLLANPTDAEVADIGAKLSPVKGDKFIPISDTYGGEYVYSGDAWWLIGSDGKINKNAALPALPVNGGFWYVRSAGAADATIAW